MGEIADDMISGIACSECGVYFEDDEDCGVPRLCDSCDEEDL